MALQSVISDSNRVPGTYTLVSLGVGVRSAGGITRHVVLFGNMTSAGSATLLTEYDIFSEDEARAYFGAGSELFLMAQAALAANPGVALKAIAIAESAGVAAFATIIYAGTASGSGTRGVTMLGEEIQVAVNSGDTATAVGAAVAAAINAKTDWPVTAAALTGTVTVTAKGKGPRGNFLAVRERAISATPGITVTPPAAALAGGTTSDNPQPALDVIAAVRRRYLVAPYSDSTNLLLFRTHVEAEKAPEIGHRKRCVYGSIDTYANMVTLQTGINRERMQGVWQYLADQPPGVLAAAKAARLAAREGSGAGGTAYNFDGEILPGIKPHFLVSSRPINAQLVGALNNGITPLQTANDGTVYVVRSITSKSRDALGNADYRVLDTSKVAVPDEVADRTELLCADRFKGFNASQNPPDGQVAASGVLTPDLYRDALYEVALQAEADGLLESGSVEAKKEQILTELSTTAAGRFNGVVPLDVIEGAHQFANEIRQVG